MGRPSTSSGAALAGAPTVRTAPTSSNGVARTAIPRAPARTCSPEGAPSYQAIGTTPAADLGVEWRVGVDWSDHERGTVRDSATSADPRVRGPRTARMVLWIPVPSVVTNGVTAAGRWQVSGYL